jgi:peptidyl-prolyl cis-trans isomerase C
MRILIRSRGLIAAIACGIGCCASIAALRADSGKPAAPAAGAPDAASTAAKSQDAPPSAGVVAARVNDQPIYERQVDGLLAAATHGQPQAAEVAPRLRAVILAELIERQLAMQSLERTKQAASKQDVDVELGRLKAELERTKQSWDQFLARTGQNESTLQAELQWKLSWEKYVKQHATDEALKAYFDEHARDFDGTELRVSHILLRPPGPATEGVVAGLIQQAEKLRAEILAGKTSFDAAAKEYSVGPSRSHGGDLGLVPRHGLMDEAFTRAAFALKKDEISPPVVTNFGVHLIRVTDIKPGTKKWTDVRDELQKAFSQKLFRQIATQEGATAKVEFTGNSAYFKPGTTELVVPKGDHP